MAQIAGLIPMGLLGIVVLALAACSSGNGTEPESPEPDGGALAAISPSVGPFTPGVTATPTDPATPTPTPASTSRDFEIITVLPYDAIPAILTPEFLSASEAAGQMRPNELVIGLSINGDHRAYSIPQLSRHEIVNDVVGGKPVAVTWCPLCFTGIVYSREVAGQELTFGVSGKLIMNGLVMFDHQTDTLWSQILGEGVEGAMTGGRLTPIPSQMMTWSAWKAQHPDTLVLSTGGAGNTYINDTYAGYYASRDAGIMGETHEDDRLTPKEFVLGMVGESVQRAYPLRYLVDSPILNHEFDGRSIVVAFDGENGTPTVFDRIVGGRLLTFQASDGSIDGEALMKDGETGSTWGVFSGSALEGELAGQRLERISTYTAFWFAWSDYYPDADLYVP